MMTTRRGNIFAAASMLLLFGVLLIASPAHAQFGNQEAGRIFISMSPAHPGPEESVHITLESALIDLSDSDIVWYVNDKVYARGVGLKETNVLAGPLGSQTNISAMAQARDGATASGEAAIVPAEVDLLWESDSYVPPFFKGRALPSPGTTLRMHAIARFKSGSEAPESDTMYTWKRNGSVVKSFSGRGRSSALFPSPSLFGTDIIEVIVSNLDGSREGAARAQISSVEPILALYQDHPLFGVMYWKALSDTTPVSDTETTFAAVPYFAQADSPDDARLMYSWSVNGRDIEADEVKRSALTVNADKSDGIAQIALTITHAANLAMRTSHTWRISFGTNSNGGFVGINPLDALSQ
ncbi:MAG: hypothetical protein Q7S05_04140 [bacterium]|nr:hypothetical protein [bacterium]